MKDLRCEMVGDERSTIRSTWQPGIEPVARILWFVLGYKCLIDLIQIGVMQQLLIKITNNL